MDARNESGHDGRRAGTPGRRQGRGCGGATAGREQADRRGCREAEARRPLRANCRDSLRAGSSVMPGRPLRHARTRSTAVRFSFDGQGAWPGFNRIAKGSVGSGHGSAPGIPTHSSSCLFSSCPDLFRASMRPLGRTETVEGDARNKSGHDGGGAFRHGGKRGDRRRCARPKPPTGFAPWLTRTAVASFRASTSARPPHDKT